VTGPVVNILIFTEYRETTGLFFLKFWSECKIW